MRKQAKNKQKETGFGLIVRLFLDMFITTRGLSTYRQRSREALIYFTL